MQLQRYRSRFNNVFTTVLFGLIILILVMPNKAQVTFSRDWIPGKRISRNYEFQENFERTSKSVTYRRILLNEMRRYDQKYKGKKELLHLPIHRYANVVIRT
ncbi:uncharacterized protein LOC108739047 isoform X2 [Agrilus planipennis]|uniref:Uncharacterized protein LOC108739047 isoform X2 n=1 Tax=Agrilus planipennis TaxID=224129 RepID=A0A1W4X759_AGRPL|nr:uncharacterized protein LOC108739047 isoform X2 [Agrilus planipennis]